jgi:hypothetical protein
VKIAKEKGKSPDIDVAEKRVENKKNDKGKKKRNKSEVTAKGLQVMPHDDPYDEQETYSNRKQKQDRTPVASHDPYGDHDDPFALAAGDDRTRGDPGHAAYRHHS